MTIVVPESFDSVILPRAEVKEMLTWRKLEDGRFHAKINSSSLSVIQECARKTKYSLVEKWRPSTESFATIFGSGIHSALEVFYQGDPEERVVPKLEHLELLVYGHKPPPTNNDLVFRAVAAFLERAKILAPLPESDKRSLQNGVWILHEYFKTYADDPYLIYRDDKGPFVERGFTFRLYEDKEFVIDYFGTIDAVKQHSGTGEIICVDYKTTSFLSGYGDNSGFLDKDKPNSQYTGYLMGLREAFGISVETFVIDIIEVKAKPKTARGKGVSFPRQITKRYEEDFDEFRESVVEYVRRFAYSTEQNVWPIGPTSSCNLWGACPYKQVCASPKSMRETILRNKFVGPQ